MMPIKTFVICACLVLQNSGATQPDILTKRDSSAEVDPYAAYYAAYENGVQEYQPELAQPGLQTVSEKQGFANAMENVFGTEAGLVLGTIGALMGTLAAVGVVLNNNNINKLSLDQDDLCTSVTQAAADVPALTSAAADANVVNVFADLTAIRTAINAVVVPPRC